IAAAMRGRFCGRRLRENRRTSSPRLNAIRRMPSSFRSKIQSGPVNRSCVSVAAIGSTQSGNINRYTTMDLATAGKGSMSHSLIRVAALVAVAVTTLVSAPRAQQPSFSSGAKTVAVYATVTNAPGRLVPDLTRADFSIDDNGKRQELTVFSNDVQPI